MNFQDFCGIVHEIEKRGKVPEHAVVLVEGLHVDHKRGTGMADVSIDLKGIASISVDRQIEIDTVDDRVRIIVRLV